MLRALLLLPRIFVTSAKDIDIASTARWIMHFHRCTIASIFTDVKLRAHSSPIGRATLVSQACTAHLLISFLVTPRHAATIAN